MKPFFLPLFTFPLLVSLVLLLLLKMAKDTARKYTLYKHGEKQVRTEQHFALYIETFRSEIFQVLPRVSYSTRYEIIYEQLECH